jgi:hypothetical protein
MIRPHDGIQLASRGKLATSAILTLGACGIGLALLLLGLRGEAFLFGPPLTEDGYYALTVARNLAHGHGMTIDGTTLSNGFQPLFTMIEAVAFYFGASDAVAIRLVYVFAWTFHVAGAVLCALVARDLWPTLGGGREREIRMAIAAISWLGSPLLFGHAYNGLATGCVLFFYLAVIRALQLQIETRAAGRVTLGLLIGLMVLARIDSAFFAVAVGLYVLWRCRSAGAIGAVVGAATVAAVALLVSGPWWLYNLLDFGSFLPTSGKALQGTGVVPVRLHFAFWAIRLMFVPWVFFGQLDDYIGFAPGILPGTGFDYVSLSSGVRTAIILGAVAALVVAIRSGRASTAIENFRAAADEPARRGLVAMGLLVASAVALVVYYVFFFGSYWFYYRYFMPLALPAYLFGPILAARAIAGGGKHRRAAIAVVAAIGVQGLALPSLAFNGITFNPNAVYFEQVDLVRRYVPAEDKVAAGQSGTLGFFRDKVVNTDGKVNLAALAFRGHIWDLLARDGVRWYADWPYYVNRHLGVPLDPKTGLPLKSGNGWNFVAEYAGFYLYRAEGTGTAR